MSELLDKEWSDEQDYLLAKDLIGGLIALRAEWIYAEEKKLLPDQVLIEKWVNEQGDLDDWRKNLPWSDNPIVKGAIDAALRKLDLEDPERQKKP